MEHYIDPGAAKVLADAAADPEAKDWWELTPMQARAAMAESVALMRAPVQLAQVRDVAIPADHGAISARLYRASEALGPFLVFIHGGGWVVGTVEIYDAPVRRLAAESGWTILSVDYRLAPEDPFPAGLDDCCTATRWAYEHLADLGGDGSLFVVAGDSSGGNLAGATAQRMRDDGFTGIDHQLLIYPVVTRDFDTDSYKSFGDGFALTKRTMRSFWNQYVVAETPRYADLLVAPLEGLPPATIVTTSLDPLRSEGEDYAERLAAAGVPTTLLRIYGLLHGSWIQDATSERSYQLGHDLAGILRRISAHPESN